MTDDTTTGGVRPAAAAARPDAARPTASEPTQVRHGRLKRPHPTATLFRWIGIVAVVAVVSSGSVAAYALHDVLSSAQAPVHLAVLPGHTATPLPKPPEGQAVGEVNMLLVGTDTRTDQGSYVNPGDLSASSGAGNNDVNILLHISRDHRSISVISFPRDLVMAIPSCPTASGGRSYPSSKAMLNTALSRGGDVPTGLACSVLAVESLTGLSIPYAASITFKGTGALSTAVGGVEVCLATPIVDNNVIPVLNLAAGEQNIVGPEALAFLRSRHGVGDGSDLGRISNQQVFMSSLARQLVSGETLGNPFKLYAIAKAAAANMTLSDTLNTSALLGIFQAVRTVGLSNMVFLQYPVVDDPDDNNRVIADSYAAGQLNQALQKDQPLQLTGAVGRGAAVDPSGTPTSPATPPGTTPTSPPATTPGSSTPGSPTTPATGGTADPSTVVTLPPSVTGQTAAEKTCSRKEQ
jgi:LCP family protein required for cell wall assembly